MTKTSWLNLAIAALLGVAVGILVSRPLANVSEKTVKTAASPYARNAVLLPSLTATPPPRPRRTKPEQETSPADALAETLEIKDVLERRQALELLGLRWATEDVKGAIAALPNFRRPEDRHALIHGIFHFLSGQDPRSALEAVKQLSPGADRTAARRELLAAWAPQGAEDSPRNDYLLHTYGSGGLAMQLMSTSPPQKDLAILWAQELGPEEAKGRVLASLAEAIALSSPSEALKLGEGLTGDDYLHFIGKFTDGWAQKDGGAAFDWSMQITDPVLRENLQESIASSWATFDLDGAKNRLAALPPGATRDSLLRAVASEMASKDTAAALAWAQGLPTTTDQQLAAGAVQSVAPVGIGAIVGMQDGLPVINSLAPGAPAALSQQVQPGDRILGVDLGQGFLSTSGMDLEKVIDLIRGQPGTSVRLQLAQPGSNGFDPPRVVNLPRAQVLHPPGG